MSLPTSDEQTTQIKRELIDRLSGGETTVTVSVKGLSARYRAIVRNQGNRWMRKNGWRGATHYDPEEDTLTVNLIERRPPLRD